MTEEAKKGVPAKSATALREEETLSFWQKEKIFEKSLEQKSLKGNYVFYDGPPFATGLPHYGHILASAIKDAIPRYQTMRGHHVERRWGWDCHGLPIENIVEKDLKISGRKEIEALGVEKFNEYARGKVLTYVHEWKKTVDRIGRWVDFDGSYKTMDNSFIESVWWALKEMHGKDLMYEGTRVLPYCPRCETPIANSEIAMDSSYKDINDISVYAKFELADEPGNFFLAWTTTPWTLPGNFALAVNPKNIYVKVSQNGAKYILAKERLSAVKEAYEIVEEISGAKLIGKKYKPLFPYFAERDFKNKENAWKVYGADFVTMESGTGIVHVAPGYGEDDMNLAKEKAIPFIHHVGTDGKFTADVTDFAGRLVKPKPTKEEPKLHQGADVEIIRYLAAHGNLFAKEVITHSYPHCFRCETPLYYYAIPAWFIKISEVKKKLLKKNEEMNWIPAHLKHGRFEKSMEGAPDWNISRTRYWASPLPIWKCDHCQHIEVLGGLEELKEKTKSSNRYFIARHGESENNAAHLMSISPDAPHHLTEKGKEEALSSGKSLKGKKIDVVIASPFLRTRETAEIIAREIGFDPAKIIFDERIREIKATPFDGKSVAEWHAALHVHRHHFTQVPEGCEGYKGLKQRMGAFLYDIDAKYEGKNILIVSHDSPIWLLIAAAEGITEEAALALRGTTDFFSDNAQVRELEFSRLPHTKNFELDFHRPYIDVIDWKCSCKKGMMRRIPEVIDCWFESGSMPFAAEHYLGKPLPHFDPKKKKNFPADFVAEYIAQTRTWFYYSHAVSTILFDSIPFKNIVTTGTILAEDGQKMSKSKGNFPDPAIIFDKYGVDPLRLYLLSSPLLKSEDLNFVEKDVDAVSKKIILRLQNVCAFYEMYAEADAPAEAMRPDSKNPLDRWLLARLAEVSAETTEAMERYELDKALRPFDLFVDDLSTWYLRRSRDRFKASDEMSHSDKDAALATTRYVLVEFAKLAAPFMPFIAEDLYRRAKGPKQSVHLESWPEKQKADAEILSDMALVRASVTLGLEARMKANIKVRQPLAKLTLKAEALAKKPELSELVRDEVNVKTVGFDANLATEAALDTDLTPELKEEGEMRELMRAIQEARKTANLDAKDKVKLVASVGESAANLLKKFEKEISAVCNLSAIEIQPEKETAAAFSFA